MRADRTPYPFHAQPVHRPPLVSIGYKPAPARPRVSFMGTIGRIVAYCGSVSVATWAVLGFFAP